MLLQKAGVKSGLNTLEIYWGEMSMKEGRGRGRVTEGGESLRL